MKRFVLFTLAALLGVTVLCPSSLAETLTLPAGLTDVKEKAFFGDASLTDVALPKGLQTIGSKAFSETGLTTVHLPASLTEIADDAFDGPEKVKITAESFSPAYFWAVDHGYIASPFLCTENDDGTLTVTGCKEDAAEIVIPAKIDGKTVSAIGDGAFKGKTALTSLNLPEAGTLVRIGSGAFDGCINLRVPDLPLGLREIGDRAFNGAKVIILALPRSLNHIGEDAFTGFISVRVCPWTYSTNWARKATASDASILLFPDYPASAYSETAVAFKGDRVTCSGNVFSKEATSYRWQRSFDGLNWTDCEGEGADQKTYTFTASAENCGCYYHLATTDFTGTYYGQSIGIGYLGTDALRIGSAYVSGTDVSLSWKWILDDVTYSLYMTGPDGKETVLAEKLKNPFYDVTGLEPETAYTFRLEGHYKDKTVTSPPVSVTTAQKPQSGSGTVYRALLIGQVHFPMDDPLQDSIGDLELLNSLLQHVNGPKGSAYSYVRKVDLTADEIHKAIQTTFKDADEDDVSLFFIATHGNHPEKYDPKMIGALGTVDSRGNLAYITDKTLADWLSEIPGEVVVILEACTSGSMIYDDSQDAGKNAALDAMNAAFVNAFREKDEELERFDGDGNTEETPGFTPRVGGLRKPKFHVITSSAHLEDSFAYNYMDFPHTMFTYGLTQGVGLSGAMPCDTNRDGMASLKELADFIDAFVDPFLEGFPEHVQIYPENSDYPLFFRER